MTTVVTRVLGHSRLRDWVRQAFTPARTLSLAFLTLGGFLAGVFGFQPLSQGAGRNDAGSRSRNPPFRLRPASDVATEPVQMCAPGPEAGMRLATLVELSADLPTPSARHHFGTQPRQS